MWFLKNLPLDQQFRRVIILTSSVAMVLAGLGIGIFDYRMAREFHVRELENLGKVLSSNIQTSLEFDDRKSARSILNSLQADERVMVAGLYDAQGELFSRYKKNPTDGDSLPMLPSAEGVYFEPGGMALFQPVILDGIEIGTIYIWMDDSGTYRQIVNDIFILLAVLGFSFTAALFFSSSLQRHITRPLLRLAEMAGRVSSEKNYSYRVHKENDDEVGLLMDKFNEMLEQIESRDDALKEARLDLENRVNQRTTDLVTVNNRLQREMTVRKRAEEIVRAHYRVLELLTAGKTLSNVLDALSESVEKQIGPKVSCCVWILDEESDRLQIGSAPHIPETYIREINGLRIGPQAGAGGAAAFKKKMVIVQDINTDPLWGPNKSLALKHGFKACWAVPIMDTQGKVMGTFDAFCDTSRSPTVDELQIIKSASFMAGTAISRKKVDDDLQNYARDLARSNQDLEDFASIASHDLQEPLRKVTAFGQRLQETCHEDLNEKGREYLDRMVTAANRMKRFIDDLLDYSRITAKAHPFAPTNLNQIVKDVLFDLEFRIQ
ncbi:MAG: histidine kinase dimerization/phospho-acceptor domain-containing protein, partial [Nitrospinaceae bacterium]